MANLKVKIVKYSDGKLDRVMVPIASATAVEKGHAISYEGNKAVLMDLEAEDATFVGISEDDHAAASGDGKILVIQKCIVDAPVESGSYCSGDPLSFNTSTGSLQKDTDNTIAFAFEDTELDSVTRLRCLIDVVALDKLFNVKA